MSALMKPEATPAVILRHAEERTQLAVACAALVNRLEQLESEINYYHFDELRWLPPSPRINHRDLPASPRLNHRDAERGILSLYGNTTDFSSMNTVDVLRCVMQSSTTDAARWRAKIIESSSMTESEREAARNLMQFDLTVALRSCENLDPLSIYWNAGLHREYTGKLEQNLSDVTADRDTHRRLHGTVAAELQAVKRERDVQAIQLENARKELQALAANHDEAVRDKINAVADAKKEAHDARMASGMHETNAKKAERNLAEAVADRDVHRRLHDTCQSELATMRRDRDASSLAAAKANEENCNLHSTLDSTKRTLESQLAAAHDDRHAVCRTVDLHIHEGVRLTELLAKSEEELAATRIDLGVAMKDNAHKETILSAAHRKVEFLNSRCQNLEAALSTATAKNVDVAIEKNRHREKSVELERRNNQLQTELDVISKTAYLKSAGVTTPPHSPLSTAASSNMSTPRRPLTARAHAMAQRAAAAAAAVNPPSSPWTPQSPPRPATCDPTVRWPSVSRHVRGL